MNVGNYILDKEQKEIVLDDTQNLLVVAGAGSGKTLTILGKIDYLIKTQKLKEDEILCISFTKEAATSLKNKIKKELNLNINTFTFHKLSLEIIKNDNYKIAEQDMLDNIINVFFIEKEKDIKKLYKKKLSQKEIQSLKNSIKTFIKLFKCNNYKLSDFLLFKKKIKRTISYKKYKREKVFLILSLNIYLEYEKYLSENNEIDFDDMLIKATNKIQNEDIDLKYKYIIIDEYQDTSYIRFNLIKEIINKTNSKLMVVGDDFQSIYRFTGCNLDLFTNFHKYFKESKVLKIQTTYRNSNELVKIVGNFVMKNKYQIKKELKSNINLKDPIVIYKYNDIKKIIKQVINMIPNDKEILILGRNNKDINMILDDEIKQNNTKIIYKDYNIKYLTIHKSKGLESDYVIIINLINDILGLPSKIKEEEIFRLVCPKEKSLYAEERRLFYVALTRTKNKVFLLVPNKNQSIFINEIKQKCLIYKQNKN